MSASLKPLTVDEFLTWERAQPLKYEFDGIQPVAKTGGTRAHSRVATRLTAWLVPALPASWEAFGPDLKVLTPGRVRYPDASVVCADGDDSSDLITPTVVFEVLSPSTALTDRRVKAAEYAGVATILAYVMLEPEHAEITVRRRRSTGWVAEMVEGLEASLALPEIGVTIPLAALYRRIEPA